MHKDAISKVSVLMGRRSEQPVGEPRHRPGDNLGALWRMAFCHWVHIHGLKNG
jgi:hypothetical protein